MLVAVNELERSHAKALNLFKRVNVNFLHNISLSLSLELAVDCCESSISKPVLMASTFDYYVDDSSLDKKRIYHRRYSAEIKAQL